MITWHCSLCHEAWRASERSLLCSPHIQLAASLPTRAGCISYSMGWHFWLSRAAHWPRPTYFTFLLWGTVQPNKATWSHGILQQCLTAEKTPFVFLDKRINKIKRLSNHKWKINCHIDSTLKQEAGANSSFSLSCNAIILAQNGSGCCVLSSHSAVQCMAFRIKVCALSKQSWVSGFSPLKEMGRLFSYFICITAKGIKWVVRAETIP